MRHLSVAPVRGQLDPVDPSAPPGWRYIQTTDTINQFRVLLPPATSSYYEKLLALEQYELSTPLVAWDRVLAIRHLKDRMIRKCERLSGETTTKRLGTIESFIFQTVVAPADFRLKEMEKWLRLEQQRAGSSADAPRQQTLHRKASSCCTRCMAGTKDAKPGASHSHTGLSVSTSSNLPSSSTCKHGVPRPGSDSPRSLSNSPEPLPIPPVRPQSERDADGEATGQATDGSHQVQDVVLRRRRSCIKRSSSDAVKTVSWVDTKDPDWMSQTNQEENAIGGTKWETIQMLYREQLCKLDLLCDQVVQGLERLNRETAHLQEVHRNITSQQEELRRTFKVLEENKATYDEQSQYLGITSANADGSQPSALVAEPINNETATTTTTEPISATELTTPPDDHEAAPESTEEAAVTMVEVADAESASATDTEQ